MSRKDKKRKKKKVLDEEINYVLENSILGEEQSFIQDMEESIIDKEESNLIMRDEINKGPLCDDQSTFCTSAI